MITGGPRNFSIFEKSAPLPRRLLLDTHDTNEAVSVASRLSTVHEIAVQSSTDFHAQLHGFLIGDVRLVHVAYGEGFTLRSQPLDAYVVSFILNGFAQIRSDAGVDLVGPEEATAISPDSEHAITWSPGAEVLALVVPRTALVQHLRRISGVVCGDLVLSPRIEGHGGHLLRSIIGAALSASSGGLDALPEALSWQMRDGVLTAILLELPHNRSGMLRGSGGGTARRVCDEAIMMMREHLSDPLPMPVLAAKLGVGERDLRVSFREHLGTTPRRKLRQLRLEAVHDALLRAPADDTVTQIAIDVGGFFHLGRFANEYMAMFGEHPSTTLRRQPGDVLQR